MAEHTDHRLIVAVTGASGSVYAYRALELLAATDLEIHLVLSAAARRTLLSETDWQPGDFEALADVVHSNSDIGASIASGSFRTRGMLIVPCSIKTMSQIAHGITDNLIARAADVVLKERRRLVVAVRETPLHTGHLTSMLALSQMGAVVAPPVPAMYDRPRTVADIVDQTVGRLLDLFDIDSGYPRRWGEDIPTRPGAGSPTAGRG